jgi:hypothetical protein
MDRSENLKTSFSLKFLMSLHNVHELKLTTCVQAAMQHG